MVSPGAVGVGAEDVEEEDTIEANALVAAEAFEDTGAANDGDEVVPENEKGDAAGAEGAGLGGLGTAGDAAKEKGVDAVAPEPNPEKPANLPGAGAAYAG